MLSLFSNDTHVMTNHLPETKLDAIVARHDIITATLAGGPDAETFVSLSRELSELDPVVEGVRAYRAAVANFNDIEALLNDRSMDAEMRARHPASGKVFAFPDAGKGLAEPQVMP